MPSLETGRINQKRRTRAAIVAAAAALLQAGQTPTVAEVADAAGVSRATAYRYFPAQDLLLAEAALELQAPDIAQVVAHAGAAAEQRLDAVVTATLRYVAANEAAFRTLLRLSVEPADQATPAPRRRAGRRLSWAARALEPLSDRLEPAAQQRLVAALALLMGIETLVVLKDVCGLDEAAAEEVVRWAAQTLLAGATGLY
jgi:AcrR family transcriptional regulator